MEQIASNYNNRIANAYMRTFTTDAIWEYWSKQSRGNYYFATRAIPFQIDAKDAKTAVKAAIMGVVTNPELGAR